MKTVKKDNMKLMKEGKCAATGIIGVCIKERSMCNCQYYCYLKKMYMCVYTMW